MKMFNKNLEKIYHTVLVYLEIKYMRKIRETETLKATPLTIVTGIALERSK